MMLQSISCAESCRPVAPRSFTWRTNRSVQEIVVAAVQEDADAIAISSYRGGHIEYFKYLVDKLRELGAGHIRIFGGGGGVIIPAEIKELHDYGVARIYTPQDGQQLGLQGMIDDMLRRCRQDSDRPAAPALIELGSHDPLLLTRVITGIESDDYADSDLARLVDQAASINSAPILGITGTGGAGKSSSTDELIRRFRQDSNDNLRIAVLAIDPTRKKTGGALLGDRIRMNAIDHGNIFMRSLATRSAAVEIPNRLSEILAAIKLSGFDLIIVETPGIGQGDAGIVPFVDTSLYIMTPEFGAASSWKKSTCWTTPMCLPSTSLIARVATMRCVMSANRCNAIARHSTRRQKPCQCSVPSLQNLTMTALLRSTRHCGRN